jgi:acylglycerol lipase
MLRISPQSRPPYALELIARALSRWGGRLGFAEANRGKGSDDPGVEAEFSSDPQVSQWRGEAIKGDVKLMIMV